MNETGEMRLAVACSEAMHKDDMMAKHSDMQPRSIGPGRASVSMVVQQHMLNGFGTCHGGMIFALADTAFAHACNNQDKMNVSMDCRIDYLSPAYLDDRLESTARPIHQGRRSGLYEITVKNQNGRNIAVFQGRSYALNKPVIDN